MSVSTERQTELRAVHEALRQCRLCPDMLGPPVHGEAVLSPVMLIAQAPGVREIEQGRPFCWTAGKTLFGWFADIGLHEQAFRRCVSISAVCRCFPGKNPRGGDRLPSKLEVRTCAHWWQQEMQLIRPRLIIPVGKLAIAQFMPVRRLDAVVGKVWPLQGQAGACVEHCGEQDADVIPLPHPSGVSTWFKTEPGKTLLDQALRSIAAHPAWRGLPDDPRFRSPSA